MNAMREIALSAVRGEARAARKARSHPLAFFLGEVWRLAALLALLLTIADALSVEVLGTTAPRRLAFIVWCALAFAAVRVWRLRRRRPPGKSSA